VGLINVPAGVMGRTSGQTNSLNGVRPVQGSLFALGNGLSMRPLSIGPPNVQSVTTGLVADFPRVVVRVQASCAHAHESSMSMLMELSWACTGSESLMGMLMEAPWAHSDTYNIFKISNTTSTAYNSYYHHLWNQLEML
jgi:hypothetical protein